MPRISETTLARIKNEIPISSVLEWCGVQTSGINKAFCPLCKDKDSRHPGMVYDDTTNTWHCFVHNGGGDAIEFVRQLKGETFSQAVEDLAHQFNIDIIYDEQDSRQAALSATRSQLIAVHKTLNEIFVKQRVSPKFKQFVSDRQLSDDAVSMFSIGMSDARWTDAAVKRLQVQFDDKTIIDSGVCYQGRDGRLWLRWQDRVMFPIRNASGIIVAFGGRDITGTAKGKYINSKDTLIFHKKNILYGFDTARQAIAKTHKAIVCEGYMDTIALQSHGFRNAVGAMGTAVTSDDLVKLSQHADTIVIALDADKAGRDAAARVLKTTPKNLKASISVMQMPLDKAKDADEWLNQKHYPAEDLQKLIDNAIPLYLFCLENAVSEQLSAYRIANSENAKAQAVHEMYAIASRFAEQNAGSIDMNILLLSASWLIQQTHSIEQPDMLAASWLRGAADSRVSGSYSNQSQQGQNANNQRTNGNADRKPAVNADSNPSGKDAAQHPDSQDVILYKRLIWHAYYHAQRVGKMLTDLMDNGFDDEIGNLMMGSHPLQVLLMSVLSNGIEGQDVLESQLDDESKKILMKIRYDYQDESDDADADWAVCKDYVRYAMNHNLQKLKQADDFSSMIKNRQKTVKLEQLPLPALSES